MKAVILAGGLGTRLSEETHLKPKPMIEIGGKPILWHIMKIYSAGGVNEFIICTGYKGYLIKEFFANYFLHTSDVTFDIEKNDINIHTSNAEPWKVTIVDTGHDVMTGGRLKRIRSYLDDEDFCMTYGDGLSNVNISDLVAYHKNKGLLATVTAVQPPGRFGALSVADGIVSDFTEKPQGDKSWINGGFFVLSPDVIEYIASDETHWEQEPMQRLAQERQLAAYHHHGFWQAMDTQRDLKQLQAMWDKQQALWMTW
jgi:glucose-1-phosphate cytidylyltransferase